MHKKLDESTIEALLETGIREFAEKGLDRANINNIAGQAGLSVGVIYKYYASKDTFFIECVRHGLKTLDSVLEEAFEPGDTIRDSIHKIVRALQHCGKEHGEYYVLYNEITSGSCRKYAAELANEIESRTAGLYEQLFSAIPEADPKMVAFLFDNLLMMLQFSYGCDYYKERMKIFLGPDCFSEEEKIAEELADYICRALDIK